MLITAITIDLSKGFTFKGKIINLLRINGSDIIIPFIF